MLIFDPTYRELDFNREIGIGYDWVQACDVPLRKWDSGASKLPTVPSQLSPDSKGTKKRPSPESSPTKLAEELQDEFQQPGTTEDEEFIYTEPKRCRSYPLAPNSPGAKSYTAKTHELHAMKVIELTQSFTGDFPEQQLALLDLCQSIISIKLPKMQKRRLSLSTIAEVLSIRVKSTELRDRILEDLRLTIPAAPTRQEVSHALNQHISTYNRHQHVEAEADPPQALIGRPPKPILQNMNPATHKQRLLLEWTATNAPVHSGSRNFRSFRHPTVADAYQAYKEHVSPGDENSPDIYSESRFTKLMRTWGIHTEKFDRYSCPKCRDPNQDAEHHEEKEKQREAYKEHKKMVLDGKAAFLITDYARIHEIGTVRLRIDGKETSERMKLSCLSFVLVAKDPEVAGGLVYENFDFTSARKQRTDFFKEAMDKLWEQLMTYINFDWERIFLWADGGMRTAGNLTVLSELQKSISSFCIENGASSYPYLQANFYAPYHGHNVCDGHFGQVKLQVRKSLVYEPATREAVTRAAQRVPRTHVEQIRDCSFEKKEKVVAKVHALHREDAGCKGKPVPFTKYSCFFFDPCSTAPFILFKNSLLSNQERGVRTSIKGTLAEVSPPLKEKHLGDSQPWLREST